MSQDDPRYFERSSGDLFFPIGPASGTDPSIYRDTGINLERPWMAGQAAYSTNFARWMRIDLPMGNEGFDNPLTFTERYPSHELSRELYYPGGPADLDGALERRALLSPPQGRRHLRGQAAPAHD